MFRTISRLTILIGLVVCSPVVAAEKSGKLTVLPEMAIDFEPHDMMTSYLTLMVDKSAQTCVCEAIENLHKKEMAIN